jgi:hypothetical protein
MFIKRAENDYDQMSATKGEKVWTSQILKMKIKILFKQKNNITKIIFKKK